MDTHPQICLFASAALVLFAQGNSCSWQKQEKNMQILVWMGSFTKTPRCLPCTSNNFYFFCHFHLQAVCSSPCVWMELHKMGLEVKQVLCITALQGSGFRGTSKCFYGYRDFFHTVFLLPQSPDPLQGCAGAKIQGGHILWLSPGSRGWSGWTAPSKFPLPIQTQMNPTGKRRTQWQLWKFHKLHH